MSKTIYQALSGISLGGLFHGLQHARDARFVNNFDRPHLLTAGLVRTGSRKGDTEQYFFLTDAGRRLLEVLEREVA